MFGTIRKVLKGLLKKPDFGHLEKQNGGQKQGRQEKKAVKPFVIYMHALPHFEGNNVYCEIR